MVSFFVYDISFMIVFSVLVAIFLMRHKKAVKREGIMFMYKTKLGIKAINYIGDNCKKLLHKMKYVIIPLGFALMGTMLYMLGQTLYMYISNPEITKIIKAPPIAPLIPYFPKLFNMESFFPPFYFTYFILALAVVAIVHEFSHGIFMKTFKIKIKSTGIVFLGPILGAFVEQDDKSMKKKTKTEQMTVLGAGVFANVIFALIFYLLYVLFFLSSFAASGYVFNSYGVIQTNLSSIETVGGNLGTMGIIVGGSYLNMNLTEVEISGRIYLMDSRLTEYISQGIALDNYTTIFFEKSPALVGQMRGAIIQANDVKIMNQDSLMKFMQDASPGDNVAFITESEEGEIKEYNITLATHPEDSSRGYLGVGTSISQRKGAIQIVLSKFMGFKEASTYYKPTWDGEFVYFIYYLLWWVMLINLLVALFNMMPLGILDGGRFFYLAVLGIFKKEKTAKIISKIMAKLILGVFILMMVYWLVGIL